MSSLPAVPSHHTSATLIYNECHSTIHRRVCSHCYSIQSMTIFCQAKHVKEFVLAGSHSLIQLLDCFCLPLLHSLSPVPLDVSLLTFSTRFAKVFHLHPNLSSLSFIYFNSKLHFFIICTMFPFFVIILLFPILFRITMPKVHAFDMQPNRDNHNKDIANHRSVQLDQSFST